MVKNLFTLNRSALGVVLVGVYASGTAQAVPVLGGMVNWAGGPVTVEIMGNDAAFVSELQLYASSNLLTPISPACVPGISATGIALGAPPSGPFDITCMISPNFSIGDELVFAILVTSTPPGPAGAGPFFMGPASRNPDGVIHAATDNLGGGVFEVGFEDILGGGDMDYNDLIFRFTGVVPASEPGVLALAGLGLLGLGLSRRKRA